MEKGLDEATLGAPKACKNQVHTVKQVTMSEECVRYQYKERETQLINDE